MCPTTKLWTRSAPSDSESKLVVVVMCHFPVLRLMVEMSVVVAVIVVVMGLRTLIGKVLIVFKHCNHVQK